MLDRLVARWDLSSLNVAPFIISVVSIWPMIIAASGMARAIGVGPIPLCRGMFVVWVAIFILETGRSLWTLEHRYASPRWLRAVHAALGDEVAVHAVAELMRNYRYDRDYVVLRSDLVSAVRRERARRKDAARRAKGVRLVEDGVQGRGPSGD